MTDRRLFVIIGAMRSGKSFFADSLVSRFTAAGGFAVVYGVGKPQDWKSAKLLELVDYNTQRNAAKRAKVMFDERLHYAQDLAQPNKYLKIADLPLLYKGAAVKFHKGDRNTDRAAVQAFFLNFGKSLIVFDDCREIFRYGVPAEFLSLISKINHAGYKSPYPSLRGMGSDVILIFHGVDQVNPEIWTYATDVVQFYTPPTETPTYSAVDNPQVRHTLEQNTEWLSTAPKYSKTLYRPQQGKVYHLPKK